MRTRTCGLRRSHPVAVDAVGAAIRAGPDCTVILIAIERVPTWPPDISPSIVYVVALDRAKRAEHLLRRYENGERNFRGLRLSDVNLIGIDLRDTHLTSTDLRMATYDLATRFPGDFSPRDAALILRPGVVSGADTFDHCAEPPSQHTG